MGPDRYCDEVVPGTVKVEVLVRTENTLAFRPPLPGFGTDHIIVIPTRHVSSLLDLDDDLTIELLSTVKNVAALAVDQHGGCQVLTTLGDEQHNKHLHWHVAVGDGVARFVPRA
ncbi:histidine triad (HIT) family protein [Lentzea atacamensis]|uniref:Histidine triad (HIT) family protein n=1 Tax=Lentzea atacamensis TaxID=531938 RepID=A0A316IBP8_9PSEU|nr:HIT domain-containing protein [Lentzea atacamensis]PWK90631.1 histidine triad (HIT) family protein [Lentzea atacamensis]RAS68146.1 histidine triad (HIT) family protein [Lentzea atacamensis]